MCVRIYNCLTHFFFVFDMHESSDNFHYDWKDTIRCYISICIAYVMMDFGQVRILQGRRRISKTCVHLRDALIQNSRKHTECRHILYEMGKKYGTLCEHVNLKAKAVVKAKQLEAQRRNQPSFYFTRDDLRLWLFEFPEYAHEIEEAETLRIKSMTLRKNEKALSHIGVRLQMSFISCVQRLNSADLAEHLKDITEILRNIKEEGLDHILNDMFKDIGEFQDKMIQMKDIADVEAHETFEALGELEPSVAERQEQLAFLDEVIGMTGVLSHKESVLM